MTDSNKYNAEQDAYRCRQLWSAVLKLAWTDCFGSRHDGINQEEAINFCLSGASEWQEARQLICDLAGIDPQAFFERAKAKARELEQVQEKAA